MGDYWCPVGGRCAESDCEVDEAGVRCETDDCPMISPAVLQAIRHEARYFLEVALRGWKTRMEGLERRRGGVSDPGRGGRAAR